MPAHAAASSRACKCVAARSLLALCLCAFLAAASTCNATEETASTSAVAEYLAAVDRFILAADSDGLADELETLRDDAKADISAEDGRRVTHFIASRIEEASGVVRETLVRDLAFFVVENRMAIGLTDTQWARLRALSAEGGRTALLVAQICTCVPTEPNLEIAERVARSDEQTRLVVVTCEAVWEPPLPRFLPLAIEEIEEGHAGRAAYAFLFLERLGYPDAALARDVLLAVDIESLIGDERFPEQASTWLMGATVAALGPECFGTLRSWAGRDDAIGAAARETLAPFSVR